jgi:hypothetical protein
MTNIGRRDLWGWNDGRWTLARRSAGRRDLLGWNDGRWRRSLGRRVLLGWDDGRWRSLGRRVLLGWDDGRWRSLGRRVLLGWDDGRWIVGRRCLGRRILRRCSLLVSLQAGAFGVIFTIAFRLTSALWHLPRGSFAFGRLLVLQALELLQIGSDDLEDL